MPTKPLLQTFKSSPALQAGLYYARKNRLARQAQQVIDGVYYAASTPNPDAEGGTTDNGPGGDA
jgi:hypothetical protein